MEFQCCPRDNSKSETSAGIALGFRIGVCDSNLSYAEACQRIQEPTGDLSGERRFIFDTSYGLLHPVASGGQKSLIVPLIECLYQVRGAVGQGFGFFG